MPTPGQNSGTLRFDLFTLDLRAGELHKSGRKIKLQEQPFLILVMLLEQPGQVVTREELRERLWPKDTFVDFDHSLNTAVNKLREALGDVASNPRFVQTVARRGYRFIAPVQESIKPGATPPENASAANTAAIAESPPTAQILHPELQVPIPRRGLTRSLFLLIQVMYLLFYLEGLFHWQGVYQIAASFLPGWASTVVIVAVLTTAGIGIPLRCYLISAVAFDHRRFGDKFGRIFPFLLAMDQLWAVAPFLLAGRIGFGAAFAATAALLYVPFSERTLVRLAYPRSLA